MPNCPCAPLPMCPITHVPHPPRYLISIFNINHDTPLPMSHCPCVLLPICPRKMLSCQKDVKLSKRCQVVKKMSNVKKSNTWTMEEVHKKINWHNEVHTYWRQFWRHIWWWPKNPQNVHRKCFRTILVTFIFDVKIDVNMCEPHYVNLFFLWTSSIVHVFDFLTFDIFLTNCHLFDILTSFNLNHLSLSQGYFYCIHVLVTLLLGLLAELCNSFAL